MSAVRKSPQLEDGHIRIANELFDAIMAFPFTGRQLKVVLAVLRKTYGYGKKEDDISASQIGTLCGIARSHVTATLQQLVGLNVLMKSAGHYGSMVGINKDYSKWIEADSASAKTVHPRTESVHVPKMVSASTESVQVDSTDSVHTKDNLPKDNKQKEPAIAVSSVPNGYAKLALVPNVAPTHVPTLPLKDGSEYEVSEDQVAEWSAAYPKLDVPAELLRMRVWLRAKPQNLKTRRGIGAFVVGWLGRSQTPRNPPSARTNTHGNFDVQNYRAGVADDGSF